MHIFIKTFCLMAVCMALVFPSPLAADDSVEIQASFIQGEDFVILPGDLLQISVWKEDGMDREVLVLPDGTITFPLIGTINARGLSPARLQSFIRAKLEAYIPDAAVTVSVKAPTGHKVSLLGQVQAPGEVILTSSMSAMQAISQIGGLTPYADEDEIIIIRKNAYGKKEKIPFPYKAITKGRELEKDITLLPGDVIVVPAAGLF